MLDYRNPFNHHITLGIGTNGIEFIDFFIGVDFEYFNGTGDGIV